MVGVNGGVAGVGGTPMGPTGRGITITGGGDDAGRAGGACSVEQPASTMATAADASRLRGVDNIESLVMWILFLEAAVALCVLVFIVWWTMFSGRK
jgi:hypothetical protein